jgi:hypothetical protein
MSNQNVGGCPFWGHSRRFWHVGRLSGYEVMSEMQMSAAPLPWRSWFACNNSFVVISLHETICTIARGKLISHQDDAAGRNLDSRELGSG